MLQKKISPLAEGEVRGERWAEARFFLSIQLKRPRRGKHPTFLVNRRPDLRAGSRLYCWLKGFFDLKERKF